MSDYFRLVLFFMFLFFFLFPIMSVGKCKRRCGIKTFMYLSITISIIIYMIYAMYNKEYKNIKAFYNNSEFICIDFRNKYLVSKAKGWVVKNNEFFIKDHMQVYAVDCDIE